MLGRKHAPFKPVAGILTFCILLLGASLSSASTFRDAVTLDKLISKSDTIFVATAAEATTKLARDGNVFSELRFSHVETPQAGGFVQAPDQTLFIWGGVTDHEGNPATSSTPPPYTVHKLSSMPDFRQTQRYLIFVNGNGANENPFTFGEYGVFKVGPFGRLQGPNGLVITRTQNGEGYSIGLPPEAGLLAAQNTAFTIGKNNTGSGIAQQIRQVANLDDVLKVLNSAQWNRPLTSQVQIPSAEAFQELSR